MDTNNQRDGFNITKENISQVRRSAENKLKNPKIDSRDGDTFYHDVNELSKRIEELVQKIEEFPNPVIRSLLAECIEAVLKLHGAGLQRILKIIDEENGKSIKQYLLEDDFIKGLLLIHNLHPDDLKTRLYRALDKVKPYMDSHGGSVEVVSIEAEKATLRLGGSCDGCPSSATTLELGIKQAVEEECPDLLDLEVLGVADNPLAREIRNLNMQAGWTILAGAGKLGNEEMKRFDVNDISVVICKVNDKLYAYRDYCPGCKGMLSAGQLDGGIIRCKVGHDFEVQHAGICPGDESTHLDPFPLLEENGSVKVAVR